MGRITFFQQEPRRASSRSTTCRFSDFPKHTPPRACKPSSACFKSSLERASPHHHGHGDDQAGTDRDILRPSRNGDGRRAGCERPVPAFERRGRFRRPSELWDLKPHRYGLCISTLEPRKKILEFCLAWRRLPEDLRREFPLVLAGGSGWENEAIHNAIETGVAEGWLRHLGFVEEAMLPALYAGAALFVYPSIYEGFGLPPIEAMASGVPVIVSNRSCLPEVCGAAARYIDPDDEEDFASALLDSLEDAGWRSRAARMGLERASEFSWDRCVNETLAVYRKVINPL